MPEVTSLAIPSTETPRHADRRSAEIIWSATLTSGIAASADTITVCTLPANARVTHADFRVDGSLGTGATIQLRHNTSALTAATTAGGADGEIKASVVGPATSATKVDFLVGTSAITASANVVATLGYVV